MRISPHLQVAPFPVLQEHVTKISSIWLSWSSLDSQQGITVRWCASLFLYPHKLGSGTITFSTHSRRLVKLSVWHVPTRLTLTLCMPLCLDLLFWRMNWFLLHWYQHSYTFDQNTLSSNKCFDDCRSHIMEGYWVE